MSSTVPSREPSPEPSPTRGLRAHAVLTRGDFRLDAQLSVGAGEVLAVLGPNGAGKTTLLRILAGLLAVTEGSVVVDDQIWDDAAAGVFVPAPLRAAGLVFQDYRLFPHLDVLDNIAFAARARGVRRAAARAEAAGVADRLGIGELTARRPGELSGGQAQRVALARVLAARPRMLLLDEPLAALDARTRLELRAELRRRLAAFDGPSIVVTHDPLEALVLADRILVLEAGRVVQSGTPAEVARHPATEYVARLMGLNLYSGVSNRDGSVRNGVTQDRIELDGGGTLVTTSRAAPEPGRQTGPVLVVLAPAAISVHRERPGPGSPRNVWAGRVDGLELLTDRVRLAVTGPPDALVDVTPAAVAELGLAPGQEVWLSAKATEVIAYPRPAG